MSCPRPGPWASRSSASGLIPSIPGGRPSTSADLAATRHWKRIIVVSERTQATRARLLFERCTSAQLVMDPVQDPRSRLFFDVAYEWAALFKAVVLKRSC